MIQLSIDLIYLWKAFSFQESVEELSLFVDRQKPTEEP